MVVVITDIYFFSTQLFAFLFSEEKQKKIVKPTQSDTVVIIHLFSLAAYIRIEQSI